MTTATYSALSVRSDEVYVNKPSPFDYALFTLPHVLLHGVNQVTDEKATAVIPIRARLVDGLYGSYNVQVGNGVMATMTITRNRSRCNSDQWEYFENPPMITHFLPDSLETGDNDDYLELHLKPGINWLERGQQFHVFRIKMKSSYNNEQKTQLPVNHMPDILFGVQRPD